MSLAIEVAPVATLIIIAVALVIAFINTALNKALISHFIGWNEYRAMQKEVNAYRKETMAAARANDKKQLEKLKKKESQINAINMKMMKPQYIQLGISFIYIIIWMVVLYPTFGLNTVAYIPGYGPITVIVWYPIGSFFLAIVSQRVIGTLPME